MKKHLFSILILLLFSINLFAQNPDYYGFELEFIGFSKDGKYLAFEEYGTSDPAAYPYSTLHFVNVEKNSYVYKPVYNEVDKQDGTRDNVEKLRQKVRAKNSAKFSQLKIVSGNVGEQVWTTPNGYWIQNSDEPADKINFNKNSVPFELNLKNIPYKYKDSEGIERDLAQFELTLVNQKTKTKQTLQKDGIKTHRGALEYRIKDVYLQKDMIAVFLVYETYGHYGQTKYMVVTGKIK